MLHVIEQPIKPQMDQNLSMDQVFIRKLAELLDLNLSSENFGVKELTKSMGVSRSKLHRKLKRITGKSTSQFVREYRLKKSMTMLLNEEATASEIAYKVGFNSPTYFNSTFHQFYGFPPGEVKFRKEEIENNGKLIIETTHPYSNNRENKAPRKRVWLFILASLGLTVILSSIIYSHSTKVEPVDFILEPKKELTIGIIPFKNLSTDNENQHIVDGVKSEIQGQLSKIPNFILRSETSMERYRSTEKTTPEIAKELKVNYLAEASVLQENDSLRIIFTLIDAKKDVQVWSKTYDYCMNQILTVHTDIAKKIALALKKNLSPEELETLGHEPTYIVEAFKLYAKGRSLWKEGTTESLNESLTYFNKALKQDSSYAMAYVGLADSYTSMRLFDYLPQIDGFIQAKKYIKKALDIDQNIAEAHTTLGILYMLYDYDWEKAEKEFITAISLNPYSAEAHRAYGQLLNIMGKDGSNEEYEKSRLLDPIKYNGKLDSIFYLRGIGKYEKALDFIEKYRTEGSLSKTHWVKVLILMRLNNYDAAVEEMQSIFIAMGIKDEARIFGEIYKEKGLNGVLERLLVTDKLYHKRDRNYYQAKIHTLLGNTDMALDKLEKAIYLREPEVIFIVDETFIKILRDEPRFIEMMEKIGLSSQIKERIEHLQ